MYKWGGGWLHLIFTVTLFFSEKNLKQYMYLHLSFFFVLRNIRYVLSDIICLTNNFHLLLKLSLLPIYMTPCKKILCRA